LINCLIFSKKKDFKKINKLNKRVLYKNKVPSSEKMSSIFKILSKKINYNKTQVFFYIKMYLFFFDLYYNLKSNIYNFLYSHKNINEYKFEAFEKKKLYNEILRFSKIYKYNKKIKVMKLGKRFWLFEN
jgi:hypothetical protein